MTSSLTFEHFQPLEGSEFSVAAPGVPGLILRAAEPLGGSVPAGVRPPFSLLFSGPAEPVLPQMIYRLSEPSLGDLEVFLVPLGPGRAGMEYEAVFS